jgi:lipopolysaccharide export system protein LptA
MTVRFATLTLCLLAALPVHAERADRDKPMLLEASRVSIDDAKKIQILEGDVVITKGTMILKADRVVITEDQYGFQKGTAFSGKKGLATFRQKREGKDEYIDLTPFLNLGSSVRTTKSVREPAGGFSITFADKAQES